MRRAAQPEKVTCPRCVVLRSRRRWPARDASCCAAEEGDLPAMRRAAQPKKAACSQCLQSG